MSFRDLLRPVVSAQLMVQLAREHGLPIEQCLSNTGIAAETLQDSEAEIRTDQEIQLTRNLVAGLPHVPALGLEAGLRYSVSSFGLWGFAILSSRTIREALGVAMRYHGLTFEFSRVFVSEAGGVTRLVFDDAETPEDLRVFCLERSLGSTARIRRELTGAVLPMTGLRLRMKRPAYEARLVEACGVVPEYGAPDNSYVIEPARLDMPIAFGNATVARQVEADCRALLERRRHREGLAARVRDAVLKAPGQIPPLDAVASGLNMTARTLRRRLAGENTSYRELVEEVRRTLAQELLKAGRMKMEEVAERLGYSDATSFAHAFRRWEGRAPRELR